MIAMIKSLLMQQEKYDEFFVFSPTTSQLENQNHMTNSDHNMKIFQNLIQNEQGRSNATYNLFSQSFSHYKR
jgi:LPS O-antigen subunit length determinant protein (WzzB/FepE family)